MATKTRKSRKAPVVIPNMSAEPASGQLFDVVVSVDGSLDSYVAFRVPLEEAMSLSSQIDDLRRRSQRCDETEGYEPKYGSSTLSVVGAHVVATDTKLCF